MSRLQELEYFALNFLETVAGQDIVNNTYEGYDLQRLASQAASSVLGYEVEVTDTTDMDQVLLAVESKINSRK